MASTPRRSMRSTPPRPSTGSQKDDTTPGVVDVEIRRSKRHKAATDNVSFGATNNTGEGEDVDTVHTLLTSVFSTLLPGFWWKILPDGEYYDISLGTGQDWSSKLLPLLVAGKVLEFPKHKPKTNSSSTKYSIKTAALSNLCHAVSMATGQKLQSSVYRSPAVIINGKPVRCSGSGCTYLCLGNPAFAHPELQIKSKAKANLVLREGMEFANLSNRIKSFCEKINVDALLLASKEKAMARQNKAATSAKGANNDDGAAGQDSVSGHTATAADVVMGESSGAAAGIAARDAACAARDAALLNRTEQQIQAALQLDLEQRPRLSRNGIKEITIHNRKQAGETERNRVLQIIYLWGYKAPDLTYKRRCQIAEAACRLVAYDCGFPQTLAHTMVPSWDRSLVQSMDSGINTETATAPRHVGSKSYAKQIDETYPGYLLELWRHAVKAKGSGAKYQDLADAMNEKSAAPDEQRPNLSISSRQLEAWVIANKGAIKQSSSKKVNAHVQDEKANS